MPTYSYRCSACNHSFEKVQRITEDPIRVCESCGAEAAQRQITSGNFMLKGSGWYSDLYSGGSNKKASASSSSDSSGGCGAGACATTGACAAPAAAPSTTASSGGNSSVN